MGNLIDNLMTGAANEIERLTAEVQRLKLAAEQLSYQCRLESQLVADTHARAERAEAEAEALRKDAERYRWICDGNGYFMEENHLCGHDNEKDRADAYIDAEMGEAKKEAE